VNCCAAPLLPDSRAGSGLPPDSGDALGRPTRRLLGTTASRAVRPCAPARWACGLFAFRDRSPLRLAWPLAVVRHRDRRRAASVTCGRSQQAIRDQLRGCRETSPRNASSIPTCCRCFRGVRQMSETSSGATDHPSRNRFTVFVHQVEPRLYGRHRQTRSHNKGDVVFGVALPILRTRAYFNAIVRTGTSEAGRIRSGIWCRSARNLRGARSSRGARRAGPSRWRISRRARRTTAD